MGCLVVIIIILSIIWAVESPSTFYIGVVIVIGVYIWASIADKKKKKEEKQRKIIEDNKNNKIYEEKKIQYNINENSLTVNYKKGFATIAKTKQYIWIEEEKLCFFPAITQSKEDDYILYRIPMKDLEYYTTQENISKETEILGEENEIGSNSAGGTIDDGVLDIGAGGLILGKVKRKRESIKSQIVTRDNRETVLYYSVDGVKHSMFFDYGDYTTLLKIIPNKDHNNFVNANLSDGPKLLIIEQLKELAELKETGVLTEEEFNEKKKILLDKIK